MELVYLLQIAWLTTLLELVAFVTLDIILTQMVPVCKWLVWSIIVLSIGLILFVLNVMLVMLFTTKLLRALVLPKMTLNVITMYWILSCNVKLVMLDTTILMELVQVSHSLKRQRLVVLVSMEISRFVKFV